MNLTGYARPTTSRTSSMAERPALATGRQGFNSLVRHALSKGSKGNEDGKTSKTQWAQYNSFVVSGAVLGGTWLSLITAHASPEKSGIQRWRNEIDR